MKKNEFNEVKNLDIKALTARVKTLRAEIADIVMDKHMNTLKNSKQIRHKRKDLAQLLTVVRQKEMIETLEKGAQQ
jgi:ribosomal protein L29